MLAKIEELMHTPEKVKYPVLTIVGIMANFLKCRQGEKDTLMDYLLRFKSERDIVNCLWGKMFLDVFVKNLADWDRTWSGDDKKKFKD